MADVGPNYTLPPGYFVQSGETILPSQHNPALEDIAAALNRRLLRNGTAAMTGPLQMGGNRVTGVAAATVASDAPRLDQVTPRSAFLLSVSALSLAANEMIYASGTNVAAKTALTPFARTLLDDTTAAAARATLGAMANDDATVVRTTRTITAGNGLTGGGSLADNRTISLGTPGTCGGNSINEVTGTSHTHEIGAAIARSATRVDAGNGLTGGGNIGSDRTISMGTPSAITATSTNSASGNTHTHSISEVTIRQLIAQGAQGFMGTYVMARNAGSQVDYGNVISGGNLQASNTYESQGIALGGTWRAMGAGVPGSATLWMRVS